MSDSLFCQFLADLLVEVAPDRELIELYSEKTFSSVNDIVAGLRRRLWREGGGVTPSDRLYRGAMRAFALGNQLLVLSGREEVAIDINGGPIADDEDRPPRPVPPGEDRSPRPVPPAPRADGAAGRGRLSVGRGVHNQVAHGATVAASEPEPSAVDPAGADGPIRRGALAATRAARRSSLALRAGLAGVARHVPRGGAGRAGRGGRPGATGGRLPAASPPAAQDGDDAHGGPEAAGRARRPPAAGAQAAVTPPRASRAAPQEFKTGLQTLCLAAAGAGGSAAPGALRFRPSGSGGGEQGPRPQELTSLAFEVLFPARTLFDIVNHTEWETDPAIMSALGPLMFGKTGRVHFVHWWGRLSKSAGPASKACFEVGKRFASRYRSHQHPFLKELAVEPGGVIPSAWRIGKGNKETVPLFILSRLGEALGDEKIDVLVEKVDGFRPFWERLMEINVLDG